jgi:nucleotide-binding universal stress UspA family protein
MTRLVVGIDGSQGSKKALDWAAEEARLRDAILDVVYVYRPPEYYPAIPTYGYLPPTEEVEKEFRKHAEGVMDEAVRDLDGVKIERCVIPGHRIAATLADHSRDADLLVVGSRGHGGFTGLLLGSTSQQCVHHAPCPVVVVPGRQHNESVREGEPHGG